MKTNLSLTMKASDESAFLYRILPFRHVVDLFESRELYFSNPACWDDPYETALRHSGMDSIYAQCWCRRASSDAMWRIYSPDRTAVRIRTTRAKLRKALNRARATLPVEVRIDDVDYLVSTKVEAELRKIAEDLKAGFDTQRATDALVVKRDAFDYEAEVRAIIVFPSRLAHGRSDNLRVQVDPFNFVESILFDPRADDTFVKVVAYYLRAALGYTGVLRRSALYRTPNIESIENS